MDKKKKKKRTAILTWEQAQANCSHNRKKKRLADVANASIPAQTQQDEKRPGNENPEGGGGEHKNLNLPLPEKDLLEHVIDVLQRGDRKDFSGQPVNPKEVSIDFRTIRAKVQDGIYNNLNEFESDILLILKNAINSTGPDTDYFKEAQTIYDLAKRVFVKLKTDPYGLKSEFPLKRSRRGRKPRGEAGSSSTKHGTNHKRPVGGSNDQIGSGDPNIERRGTYMPSSGKDSILSMAFNGPKQLLLGSGISYKESLMRFTKDLGPTAQKVAAQKLATEQQPQMPTHSFIHQQPQMPTHPFIQQQPQVPISSYMGQQPRAPTHSFMGSHPLIPRRPYNMGIVTGCHAPPIPRDPITTINATERLGSRGADKGKGILANDDIDILSGTLKNAQGFNHPVAGPPYPDPPARPAFKPNSSLLEFVSRQNNNPRPSVHPSRVIMLSRLNQISGSMNQGYRARLAQLHQVPGCNPPAPSAPQVNEDYPMGMGSAPSEFIRLSPFSQDIMRWLDLQQQPVLPASRVHPLAACMPLPVRSGIPSELLGAPTHQERQHLSAPLGQEGDIYPVDQRASQQQRQHDDAGPSGRLTHQEPHHAFDPHVRPSGSSPVGHGIWQEHEQALPPGRQHLNQRGAGQGPVGPGGGGGGGGPQGGQGQQQAETNDPHLFHFI